MKPILSIVIPTRNRVECAVHCVAAALEATTRAQVVIADSGTDDALAQALQARGLVGDRVTYVHTPPEWNVVENFEGALGHCEGDFVLYLGDDDLVGPHIEQVCTWAKEAGIDAVVGYGNRFGVAYYWPGVRSKYFGDGYAARVFMWSHSSAVRRIDTRAELRSACSNAGKGLGLLPRVYHGLVAREVLQRIRANHGHVFGGVSPDIYSAVLIASEVRHAVFLDYPFCVPGASPKSEAGSGAARTDRVRFEDSPYLRRFKDLRWDPAIPRFFAPFNVWAFSLNEALKRVAEPLDGRCLARLYARCLMYCWPYRDEVFACLRQLCLEHGRLRAWSWLAGGLLDESGELAVRVANKLVLPRAGGWSRRYKGLEDSLAAYRFLEDRLPPPTLGEVPN